MNLFGGGASKNDRAHQIGSEQNLESIFNFGVPAGKEQLDAGKATTGTALDTLSNVSDYWKSLLTGGRTATLNAAAPAINNINAQSDAVKSQEAATGTGRTGGATAWNQQQATDKMAATDTAVAGVKPEAAKNLEQVAGLEGYIGSDQATKALNLLGLSGTSAANAGKIATDARAQSLQNEGQLGQAAGQAAAMIALAML